MIIWKRSVSTLHGKKKLSECGHSIKNLSYVSRFFFLSNDELLEILSETKDPLRVQPHLKKCFEGIAKLEFNEAKEILGMISGEKETVPFSHRIIPANAKGMVEKWLLEVEQVMIASIRDVTEKAMKAYAEVPRNKWVLEWPGQVVICVGSTYWTTEVTNAITERGGLKVGLSYFLLFSSSRRLFSFV